MSSYNKDDYEWFKSHKLCVRCRHNTAAFGMVLCADCLAECSMRDIAYGTAQKTKWAKVRRERLKAQGICVNCGKNPAKQGVLLCESCQKKHNAKSRIYNHMHYVRTIRPEGMCRFCPKPVVPGKKLCAAHMMSETAKLDKARAEGKCNTDNHPWRKDWGKVRKSE